MRFIYFILNLVGLRAGPIPRTFLTHQSLRAIASLSGFQIVRIRSFGYFTELLPILGTPIAKLLKLFFPIDLFAIGSLYILRPLNCTTTADTLVSVIVPARNESGNIEPLVQKLPELKFPFELIFVEGHSNDNTWDVIQNQIKQCRAPNIFAHQQPGKGKADAVHFGISASRGELIVILDSDLSVELENLNRFYFAYQTGKGDFINGNRLLYPMEKSAMRPLNWLGNLFFAKALSRVLDCPLGDTLCGTKMFNRTFYTMSRRWNHKFGKFDPFGDFEFIFPAACLGIGVLDIPVHYKARVYGETNIQRFRDGLRLLKRVFIGLLRIKLA